MRFLKNWRKKKNDENSFFGSTKNEIKDFFCGIGESEVKEAQIKIWNYPFEPSKIFPSKEIHANEIDCIHLKEYPPTIKINNELIFITRESINQLEEFANRNNIEISKRASNWNYLTEPFLDTTHSKEEEKASLNSLSKNGFRVEEINEIRNEVAEQMYKYNFDTMLWEWGILGMNDVLSAMRPKLSMDEFRDFYWRAMEIEQRKLNK